MPPELLFVAVQPEPLHQTKRLLLGKRSRWAQLPVTTLVSLLPRDDRAVNRLRVRAMSSPVEYLLPVALNDHTGELTVLMQPLNLGFEAFAAPAQCAKQVCYRLAFD